MFTKTECELRFEVGLQPSYVGMNYVTKCFYSNWSKSKGLMMLTI